MACAALDGVVSTRDPAVAQYRQSLRVRGDGATGFVRMVRRRTIVRMTMLVQVASGAVGGMVVLRFRRRAGMTGQEILAGEGHGRRKRQHDGEQHRKGAAKQGRGDVHDLQERPFTDEQQSMR